MKMIAKYRHQDADAGIALECYLTYEVLSGSPSSFVTPREYQTPVVTACHVISGRWMPEDCPMHLNDDASKVLAERVMHQYRSEICDDAANAACMADFRECFAESTP